MGSLGTPNPKSWVPLPFLDTKKKHIKDCSQGLCTTPYCLRWCHQLIDPPPPAVVVNNFSAAHSSLNISPTVVVIIGILLGAFLLISCYLALSNIRRNRNGNGSVAAASAAARPGVQNSSFSRRYVNEEETVVLGIPQPYYEAPGWYVARVGLDEAAIRGVGVCEYRRGDGLVEATDCVVCLGEFLEGETLRLLPKCSHAFHVSCIDRWFQSHTNCPLCRANVVPPPPSSSEAAADNGGREENYESSPTLSRLDYSYRRREGNDGCVMVVVVVEARRSGDHNAGAQVNGSRRQ